MPIAMTHVKEKAAMLSSNQLAAQLDQHMVTVHSVMSAQAEPAADPYLAVHVQRQSLGSYGHLYRGIIQMVLPHINAYRVALAGLNGEWLCHNMATDATHSLIGPRDISMLQPFTPVLVHKPENETEGIILGVLPEVNLDGNQNFSDCVVQGSNVGLRKDGHYEQYINTTADEGGALDYTHHRPIDQTSLDWGRMTETGLGFTLDPMMIQMRVNEMCGVFGFYQGGGALRVAGFRLDVWSGAHTEEYREDEGECTAYRGEIMYPWEAKGAFEKDKEVTQEISDVDLLYKKPLSKLEPKETDQQAFHRYEEYGGYMGQGHIRQVSVPPAEPEDLLRYSDDQKLLGVFREHIGMEGSYMLAAAKDITFVKRSVIPIAKRKKLSEDISTTADNSQNYMASGSYGSGPPHLVGEVQRPDENAQISQVMALLDIHTHKANWKTLAAFAWHQKDFKTPQESELKEAVGKVQAIPNFTLLGEQTWLEPTEPKEVQIDHRFEKAKFYELMSMISMTDDGAVVIRGGMGEAITLMGGSVAIDCPGHIYLRPGKGFICLAGDDAVVRARNSVDITSSNKDVRIKAEKNLQMLAANSGKGGLLLESRSTEKTHDYPAEGGEKIEGNGIVLKAAKSHVVTMASEIYLRTGGERELKGGPIVIDAGNGNSDVITIGRKHMRFASNLYLDAFGVETVNKVNIYSETNTLLAGGLFVSSSLQVGGFVNAGGSFTSAGGHFQSPNGGDVGRLSNAALVTSGITAQASTCTAFVVTQQGIYDNDIKEPFYGDDRVGNEEVIRRVSVGMRNETQYGTKENFVMPSCYWQQLVNSEGGVVAWEEPVVHYQQSSSSSGGIKTMPWPGVDAWSKNETLLVMAGEQLKMFDLENGVAEDRSATSQNSAYATGHVGTTLKKVPQKDYKVIKTKES